MMNANTVQDELTMEQLVKLILGHDIAGVNRSVDIRDALWSTFTDEQKMQVGFLLLPDKISNVHANNNRDNQRGVGVNVSDNRRKPWKPSPTLAIELKKNSPSPVGAENYAKKAEARLRNKFAGTLRVGRGIQIAIVDCTARDFERAAAYREIQADANTAWAEYYRKMARTLNNWKAVNILALPDEGIAEIDRIAAPSQNVEN